MTVELKGQALVPGLRQVADLVIQRRRELPVPGDLLVEIGQQVTSDQVVAQAELPGDLQVLRLPEKMGIEVFEVCEGLRVKEGDSVERGTLLCEHAGLFGWFKTKAVAPLAGVIEFISQRSGHIGLRLPSHVLQLSAYISGIVTTVEAERAVLIQSKAAFIQGIFGVGGERQGRLKILAVAPEATVTAVDIPAECAGAVLVGGTNPSLEALQVACARGATAFVTGAIGAEALAGYLGYDLGIALTGDEPVDMTVIATEGFGTIPISERVLEIVTRFEGLHASVNGATQVRAGALRPEIIIPHQVTTDIVGLSTTSFGLTPGSEVRLLRVPYFGRRGIVQDLPKALGKIATGACARVVRVKLTDGVVVTVPRANVELL